MINCQICICVTLLQFTLRFLVKNFFTKLKELEKKDIVSETKNTGEQVHIYNRNSASPSSGILAVKSEHELYQHNNYQGL